MIVKPMNFSVRKFLLIKHHKLTLLISNLFWQCARTFIIRWPAAASEYFSVEFKLCSACVIFSWVFVVSHKLLRIIHIFKHLLNFINNIVPAFYCQFTNHLFLCHLGHTCLIQEPLSQQIAVFRNKNVSSLQTAKQLYNLWQLFINLSISSLFKFFFEFVVGVKGKKMRSFFEFSEELNKCEVSCLLKVNMISKGFLDHVVHSFFKLDQLSNIHKGVFLVLWWQYNF